MNMYSALLAEMSFMEDDGIINEARKLQELLKDGKDIVRVKETAVRLKDLVLDVVNAVQCLSSYYVEERGHSWSRCVVFSETPQGAAEWFQANCMFGRSRCGAIFVVTPTDASREYELDPIEPDESDHLEIPGESHGRAPENDEE